MKTLASLFLICCFTIVSGQKKNYVPVTIHFEDGTTKDVNVKNRIKSTHKKIKTENGKINIDDISRIVYKDNPSISLIAFHQYYYTKNNKLIKKKKIFGMIQYSSSKLYQAIMAYYYKLDNKTNQLILMYGSQGSAAFKFLIKKGDNKGVFVSYDAVGAVGIGRGWYLKAGVRNLLSDCPSLVKKVEDEELDQDDLEKIMTLYDECE